MADDVFLTTDEVLDYLHLNVRTIYRLIKAGKLPAFRVGRQWRFRKTDIEAWLTTGQTVTSTDTEGDRPRVLLVDDEPAVRDLIAKALALAEYDVDLAEDGPTALELIETTPYDLLITDLKMPGMDGLSVIREVRRRSADLPVIIVTAHSTEACAVEAINLGVSGYLIKPFKVPRILSVAARALGDPVPAVQS